MALDIQEKVVRESLKQMFDKCWEDVDLVCEHPQDPACPRNRIIGWPLGPDLSGKSNSNRNLPRRVSVT